ncbi:MULTISPECIES: hypothetical protein [Streptomyces]|uniref:hypothetical protein n=1 Tax=Streptomyces TaxID=1883 RepID=UPI000788E15C|nr:MULTISPECIES: hypothetical protein [unclassified Streptomyces]AVH97784.1 hypothetical protein C5L38_24285 [Streptomyces sp. WAC00288]KYG56377.1 hypothetical protein AWI43_19910 [Streptomyces sp. WAC04657]
MAIEFGEPRRLGVPSSDARLRFEVETQEIGGGPGRRLLVVDGDPAFELSFWCGTCPLLFRRLVTAQEKLSLESVRELLTGALTDPDEGGALETFGALLPEGEYLPMLLCVEPRFVVPGKDGDYFSGEQVDTWGVDQFWGLPEYPHTPYYRTFETEVDASAHLYEFVVPMVPPTWNERERVEEYAELMGRGGVPTAVAVSTLDVCEPAVGFGHDHYRHWGLTHFLLDGHHKLEAAAAAGRPVRLLSLLALGEGLALPEDCARLPTLRARARSARATMTA